MQAAWSNPMCLELGNPQIIRLGAAMKIEVSWVHDLLFGHIVFGSKNIYFPHILA